MTGYHTPVVPETVGQFTGLLDRGGKRIFEGDVVRLDDGALHSVEYVCGAFWVCKCDTTYWQLSNVNADAVVVGNVHDNPELTVGAE
jgi:uncharacterized phage protein (TIGR01671 family)